MGCTTAKSNNLVISDLMKTPAAPIKEELSTKKKKEKHAGFHHPASWDPLMPYGFTPVRKDSTHKAAFQVLWLRANGYLFRGISTQVSVYASRDYCAGWRAYSSS